MATFHLEKTRLESKGHDAEVLACAFLPDNTAVLSGGWDGTLRLWDVEQGLALETIEVSDKPVSACAASLDGQRWLAGTMDGMLSQWDASSREKISEYLAHTRPIADLVYSPNGQQFASVGWDRNVQVWDAHQTERGQPLGNHGDIAAGCRFTPDGKHLVSWSYDGTLVAWDVAERSQSIQFAGHEERITAGAISHDGQWLITGSRNGEVKLWEMQFGQEVNSLKLSAEIQAGFFLLDNESVALVDSNGRLTLHQVPDLAIDEELCVKRSVQSAALSPAGSELVLGDAEGQLTFVGITGLDEVPLAVTAAKRHSDCTGMFRRLMGGQRIVAVLGCVCPACRRSFDVPPSDRENPVSCPQCYRSLRICAVREAVEITA